MVLIKKSDHFFRYQYRGEVMAPTGIDPKIWGPSGWRMLHGLAASIGSRDEVNSFYHDILGNLKIILPCPACQRNLTNHMNNMVVPKSVSGIKTWVVELHNRVNEAKGLTRVDNPDLQQYSSLTWKSIEKFSSALIETHPGAWKCTPQYMHALIKFWKTLVRMIDGQSVQLPESVACSRKEMRMWMYKNGILMKAHASKLHVCKNDVCEVL
jgi:Erv1 / Alr family